MDDTYGTVQYKGQELHLTQQPYLAHNNQRGEHYVAAAEDADGNEYEVTWEITNPDCEDESDACDWGDYRVKKLP